jgi:hypothetical protein
MRHRLLRMAIKGISIAQKIGTAYPFIVSIIDADILLRLFLAHLLDISDSQNLNL